MDYTHKQYIILLHNVDICIKDNQKWLSQHSHCLLKRLSASDDSLVASMQASKRVGGRAGRLGHSRLDIQTETGVFSILFLLRSAERTCIKLLDLPQDVPSLNTKAITSYIFHVTN
jgi:hypothetical protein